MEIELLRLMGVGAVVALSVSHDL